MYKFRYENIRAEDYAPIRWAWLTFKETEPAAVTGMVCLIQKLQIQVIHFYVNSKLQFLWIILFFNDSWWETEDFPDWLSLHTGQRNVQAKSAPWTPRATQDCKQTCCSDLSIWQALQWRDTVVQPRCTKLWTDSHKQPPFKVIQRIPARPRKPEKMRVYLENLEKSWNFEKINKIIGKLYKIWKKSVATKNPTPTQLAVGWPQNSPWLPYLKTPMYNLYNLRLFFPKKFHIYFNFFLVSLCLPFPPYLIWYILLCTCLYMSEVKYFYTHDYLLKRSLRMNNSVNMKFFWKVTERLISPIFLLHTSQHVKIFHSVIFV